MSDVELGHYLVASYKTGVWGALLSIPLTLILYGQIAKRAGFSRLWALLLLVPVLGAFVPIIFARSSWPIDKRKKK